MHFFYDYYLLLCSSCFFSQCDCLIPVQLNNTDSINCADQIADEEEEEKEHVTVSEKLLNKFRLYLSIVRQMKYELTEEVQKVRFIIFCIYVIYLFISFCLNMLSFIFSNTCVGLIMPQSSIFKDFDPILTHTSVYPIYAHHELSWR